MTVAKGMKVNLFASEKEFPELAKPVQMAFDARGRLWVAAWPSYPHWKPKEEMNDKLLIFEDTDGDGKADKKTVFADRPALPDRLRVRQRRRPGRAGARPDVPEGHRRRRQGRRPRARARRARLGRHPPHVEQLPARPRRGALLPGGDVPPDPGRDARTARRSAARTRGSSATSRRRRSSRSTSPSASPTRTATSSTAGARTSWSTAPAPSRTTAPCSRATLDYPDKHGRPAHGLPAAHPALPRRRDPHQPPLPREHAGEPARPQRDRLPGHPPVQDRGQGRRASPAPRSSRSSRRRDPNFRPVRHRGRARRRDLLPRLAEPDHRPHAAQPPRPQPRPDPRPDLPDHLRGPAAPDSPPRSPASRSRSCSTCSRSPRTASATGPRPSCRRRDTDAGHRRARQVGRRARQERRRLRAPA